MIIFRKLPILYMQSRFTHVQSQILASRYVVSQILAKISSVEIQFFFYGMVIDQRNGVLTSQRLLLLYEDPVLFMQS